MKRPLLVIIIIFCLCTSVCALSILHLSDIHLDPYYKEGASNDCLLGSIGLRCCQRTSYPIGPGKANKWGDYNCDTPFLLLNHTIQWIKQNIPVDYVFYTGDSVSHHDFEQVLNWNENYNTMETVNYLLEQLGVQVFSVFGNHDSYPAVDQLWGLWPVINTTNELWGIDGKQYGYGYYKNNSTALGTVLGLNCLWNDIHNLLVSTNLTKDWAGQMAWVSKVLTSLNFSQSSTPIILLSHMSPYTGEATQTFTDFIQSVSSPFLLQFYGHTHTDEYRIIRNISGAPVGVAYIVGSVMPDQHYPLFRVYDYDPILKSITNFDTFYHNLTLQWEIPDKFIGYERLYNAKESYGLIDLSLQSWVEFTQRMYENDTLFQIYCNYMAPPQNVCNKAGTLCDIDVAYCGHRNDGSDDDVVKINDINDNDNDNDNEQIVCVDDIPP